MSDISFTQPLVSQFKAALDMLRDAIETCPETLWLDSAPRNAFWHLAYHTTFYTHLYLQPSESAFRSWEKHQHDSQFLGPRPGTPHEPPPKVMPYSREDVLTYVEFCMNEAVTRIPVVPMDARSGFQWLPFTRFETHLYNLRHLQHHTGQLADRLRSSLDLGVKWVSRG